MYCLPFEQEPLPFPQGKIYTPLKYIYKKMSLALQKHTENSKINNRNFTGLSGRARKTPWSERPEMTANCDCKINTILTVLYNEILEISIYIQFILLNIIKKKKI